MLTLIGRRLLHAPLTLIGISFVVFLLIRALPGDPVDFYVSQMGPQAQSAAAIAEVRAARGLDRPLLAQFALWMTAVARGDLGASYIDHRPVTEKIAEKLPRTLLLNVLALLCAVAIALPIGILTGARSGSWLDRSVNFALLLLFSVPVFWAALLLMDWLSLRLNLLPLYGIESDDVATMSSAERIFDRIRHLILPTICLAYGQLAFLARYSRSAVEESLTEEFVTASKARGLSESRILLGHVLPHALVPLVSLLGVVLPFLISGSVIVERMFQYDGVGNLFLSSILRRDYPVVMALTLLTAVTVMVANLLTDILYGVADPRIRVAGERE
jgi:peptide/nickel transport system permease protein